MQTLTHTAAAEFEKHIGEAKEHYAQTLTFRDKTVGFAEEALKCALLCGQALIRAREACPPRQWLRLFRVHWPDLATPTAYRWMALAKAAERLTDAKTKAEAYRIIGLIPETTGGQPGGSNADEKPAITLDAIERWASRFERFSGQTERLLSLPDEEKSKVIHALEPAATLYNKLICPRVTVIDGDSGVEITQ